MASSNLRQLFARLLRVSGPHAQLCIVIGLLALTNLAHADERSVILDDISSTWLRREQLVESVDCQFQTDYFRAAKTVSFPTKGGYVVLPREDTTVRHTCRLRIFRNDHGRYEYTGPQLIQFTGEFEPREFIGISDGSTRISYFGRNGDGNGLRFYAAGFIESDLQLPEITNLNDLMGLYALYRPSAWLSARKLSFSKCHSLQYLDLNGVHCLFLRFDRQGGRYFDMYLDPTRGYVPIRFEAVTPNEGHRVSVRLDMEYETHDITGWALRSWETNIYQADGGIKEQYQSRGTQLTVNNLISDSVFRFDMPYGTVVTDLIKKERYIVKDNGKRRVIAADEGVGIENYEKVLASESPVSASSKSRIILIGVNALVAVVIGGILMRRLVVSRRIRVDKH